MKNNTILSIGLILICIYVSSCRDTKESSLIIDIPREGTETVTLVMNGNVTNCGNFVLLEGNVSGLIKITNSEYKPDRKTKYDFGCQICTSVEHHPEDVDAPYYLIVDGNFSNKYIDDKDAWRAVRSQFMSLVYAVIKTNIEGKIIDEKITCSGK